MRRTAQSSLFETAVVDDDPFAPTKPQQKHSTGILALDLATITGWCDDNSSGVWDFTTTEKKDDSKRIGRKPKAKKHLKFQAMLSEYLIHNTLKIVVYEAPIIYRAKKRKPNFVSFEFVGILKLFCVDRGIPMLEYHSAHIKKSATGMGNAMKDAMVQACKVRYGIIPQDHNQADAVHLYHLAMQDLK